MSEKEDRLRFVREALAEIRAEHDNLPSRDDVVRVCIQGWPHLYDGSFEAKLASTNMFTAEQAKDGADRQREQHELETERVLIFYLNLES